MNVCIWCRTNPAKYSYCNACHDKRMNVADIIDMELARVVRLVGKFDGLSLTSKRWYYQPDTKEKQMRTLKKLHKEVGYLISFMESVE